MPRQRNLPPGGPNDGSAGCAILTSYTVVLPNPLDQPMMSNEETPTLNHGHKLDIRSSRRHRTCCWLAATKRMPVSRVTPGKERR
jgi:hypothetical protein